MHTRRELSVYFMPTFATGGVGNVVFFWGGKKSRRASKELSRSFSIDMDQKRVTFPFFYSAIWRLLRMAVLYFYIFHEKWLQRIDVGLTRHELLPRKTSSCLVIITFHRGEGGGFFPPTMLADEKSAIHKLCGM